ncbi:serine--tRNA ligase [Candidatus Saccharibacteria bacterium]|nr:serine--tRNA ligase [Candidatus Saccharibacteria bacterium]
MLDIKYIRENADEVGKFSAEKGVKVDVDALLENDAKMRELNGRLEELRKERNEIAEAGKKARPTEEQIARGRELKVEIEEIEKEFKGAEESFIKLIKEVPNKPWDDVPVGHTEDENVVAETIGKPTEFDFEPRNHWDIATHKGWIDKERAAKVTGARFAYIKGDLVKLQMAVINWVMKVLTDRTEIEKIIEQYGLKDVSNKPFEPVLPPYMIKTEMYDAMDRLGNGEDRYKIEGSDLWLQGSAEHVLGSMYAGEILEEKDLPMRMLGYATSFRQEAGTYGKDMEGIIRMHQFDKLEMESFTTAEQGFNEHLFFVAIQRYLLEELSLPYRVLQKCTFDIGKPNARGIDMEVWLPGQGKYRETHTADYMTDYQARRLKTRVRKADGEVELIHTNDATAFALGRILIAIIENFQNQDMSVSIPAVLRPFMYGQETI